MTSPNRSKKTACGASGEQGSGPARKTSPSPRGRPIDRVALVLDVIAAVAVAALLIAMVLATGGCGGLQRDQVVKAPDAPMLIIEAKGTARVSVYDAEENRMIDAGTVDLGTLDGWTVSKYQWEELIGKRRTPTGAR